MGTGLLLAALLAAPVVAFPFACVRWPMQVLAVFIVSGMLGCAYIAGKGWRDARKAKAKP